MTEEPKIYKTAGAFRTALETRLQTRAREERTDLQRLRRQVAFDRFLARMFSRGPKAVYPWVLKGGYGNCGHTPHGQVTGQSGALVEKHEGGSRAEGLCN